MANPNRPPPGLSGPPGFPGSPDRPPGGRPHIPLDPDRLVQSMSSASISERDSPAAFPRNRRQIAPNPLGKDSSASTSQPQVSQPDRLTNPRSSTRRGQTMNLSEFMSLPSQSQSPGPPRPSATHSQFAHPAQGGRSFQQNGRHQSFDHHQHNQRPGFGSPNRPR